MLKSIIEKYIQEKKNKDFSFDKSISSLMILSFTFIKFLSLLRGYRILLVTKGRKKVFFGKSVQLYNRSNIVFGSYVNIGDFVRLHALGSGPLTLGNQVSIGSYSQVVISTTFNHLGQFITIGNNVGIGEFSYLGGAGGLVIGDDTIIGQYFSTHPENHNFSDSDTLIRNQGVNRKGITIGSNCWIGAKVTILDGVSIGDNCVVAAGAVVTTQFPDNVVIAGVPAKTLKKL